MSDLSMETLVLALQRFSDQGPIGWLPAEDAGPPPDGLPDGLACLLAKGRPTFRFGAFGQKLSRPLDFAQVGRSGELGPAGLVTHQGEPAPGWQVGVGPDAWHRVERGEDILWVAPGGVPIATTDEDLVLLLLLGISDVLAGDAMARAAAISVMKRGLWGEPLEGAETAVGRLKAALDSELPPLLQALAVAPPEPRRAILVLPRQVEGSDEKLAEAGRPEWGDVPFLFYTPTVRAELREATTEGLPTTNRSDEDKQAGMVIGAWLTTELETLILDTLQFGDRLKVYKKLVSGHSAWAVWRALQRVGVHAVLVPPSTPARLSLYDGAQTACSHIEALSAGLEKARGEQASDPWLFGALAARAR